ncbi:uncharacterized protein LOC144449608 [Glandiceps talaboti]
MLLTNSHSRSSKQSTEDDDDDDDYDDDVPLSVYARHPASPSLSWPAPASLTQSESTATNQPTQTIRYPMSPKSPTPPPTTPCPMSQSPTPPPTTVQCDKVRRHHQPLRVQCHKVRRHH